MKIDRNQYPKRFRKVINLIDSEEFQLNHFEAQQQQSIVKDIKKLCQWLQEKAIAQQSWVVIVYKLISHFKLSILLYLEKAFLQISLKHHLWKLFRKNGINIMILIRDIIGQVGKRTFLGSFNLWSMIPLYNKFNTLIGSNQTITSESKLSKSTRRIYRLIQSMTIWKFNSQPPKQKSTSEKFHDLIEEAQRIREQKDRIEPRYLKYRNEIERNFYLFCVKLFKKALSKFQLITLKLQDQSPARLYISPEFSKQSFEEIQCNLIENEKEIQPSSANEYEHDLFQEFQDKNLNFEKYPGYQSLKSGEMDETVFNIMLSSFIKEKHKIIQNQKDLQSKFNQSEGSEAELSDELEEGEINQTQLINPIKSHQKIFRASQTLMKKQKKFIKIKNKLQNQTLFLADDETEIETNWSHSSQIQKTYENQPFKVLVDSVFQADLLKSQSKKERKAKKDRVKERKQKTKQKVNEKKTQQIWY